MITHNLKVYHAAGRHGVACIRLQGNWLAKEAELRPGDRITVQVENGHIEIRKVVPEPTKY